MPWLLLATLWSSSLLAIEPQLLKTEQNITLPSIVRVYFEQKEQIQQLADSSDVWSIHPTQKFATIQITDQATLQQILDLGLSVRLDRKLMQQYAEDLLKISQPNKMGAGIPGFSCYSTVTETFQRMDQMELNFANLAEIVDIGDSWEKVNVNNAGEDLRVLKLTNKNITADKPILFLASSIHAREYTTAELNTRFAEYLLNNYGNDPDVTWILDHHEIHLSLVANPDGRKRAQTGLLWRKNTNQDHCGGSNDSGVDLNRNYPFEWGIGGSTLQCAETFRGVAAETEPEVTSQMSYLRQIFADNRGPGANDAAPADTAGIFIDIHSFSQLMLWPWGYTNSVTPNNNQLQALGKRTAFFNQYRPQPVNELVITGGGSIDATYGELGVASLAFELGTAFFQDCATFEEQILPDNIQALLYLARVTQAPYIQSLGPDIEGLTVTPNVVTAGTTVQVQGTANDDRYNQSNGAQATGSVQSVQAYINTLPIDAGSGQALTPTDGNFNDVTEAFSGTINTTALPAGKNLLYVQANDDSQPGGTFAQFIDVVEPQNVAQLSGLVTNTQNNQPIPNALLSINQSQALSTADGTYQQWVQPAQADLTVSATDYVSQTISNINLTAGNMVTQDIQLQPICVIFSDDVENNNIGWQADTPWAISTEQSNSATHAWVDSPGGNYANGVNTALTSPAIDVTDADTLEVKYHSLCDTEAGYDYGRFEVQFNGGTWQELSRCDGQSSWRQETESINLPNSATEFRMRFRLTSDVAVTADGWSIDDISVRASGPVCGAFNNDLIFATDFEWLQ